ncbi:MAG: cytoplasmic protein [Rhodoglobus sp.]|nr:cytoplasmic protein [Rhodoglobus sp.]
MPLDPVATNPGLYTVLFENDRVRVLEYRDQPGDESVPHEHPDSVMITLSAFQRRLSTGERSVDVELSQHQARWLAAQTHSGLNTGATETHTIFVELKEPSSAQLSDEAPLGPQGG